MWLSRCRTLTYLVTSRRCFSIVNDPRLDRESLSVEKLADFRFFPTFLNKIEQGVLLQSALRKLDEADSHEARRKRKRRLLSWPSTTGSTDLSDLFLPDDCYDFEEGHYDGVIVNFRETHVTSWPHHPSLDSILLRLQSLLPATSGRSGIQTHILHLASNGEIYPHIDNIEASGSCIAAISLGGERILRMESQEEGGKTFEILLPSGSAYVQRDTVRYSCKHSILQGGRYFKGRYVPRSQRISVMLRDRVQRSSKH